MRVLQIGLDHALVKSVDLGLEVDEVRIEVVASTLAGSP
jgi:hypothetical protein